ncbi:MAG: hypothetical protein A2X34_02300 [Elusimicrobia bacterium GWC2_51_8]|nr:MAG: hypothetical protein A2X33_05225 [Elusimicrobia bacterium GWA2_51_34]OGR59668.1 MAG: hypothetical protein A2X34_02300 [Elusimicrobia bacterium GWC2_51_8]OGR87503.1 MAG: hypothetical protein A2021_08900 [Elusimicrobia bacterium GWF2_52_66]HAF95981.1 hypothetical protein [Elusimicrobiota bacterium]HCE97022.1 hypothetical protein [Elusimicrobiota bacterium]
MKTLQTGDDEKSDFVKITRKINFFASMNMGLLEKILTYVTLYEYGAGEKVCRQGEKGDAFYAVKAGRLTVSVKKGLIFSKKLAELGPGDFFGEMALIDRAPRNATIACETAAKLFVLLSEHFEAAMRENPKLAEEMKSLAAARRFELIHNT